MVTANRTDTSTAKVTRRAAPRRYSRDEQRATLAPRVHRAIYREVSALGLPSDLSTSIAACIADSAITRALDESPGLPLLRDGVENLANAAEFWGELQFSSFRRLFAAGLPEFVDCLVSLTSQNAARGARAISEGELAAARSAALKRLAGAIRGAAEDQWPIGTLADDTDFLEAFFPQWELTAKRLLPAWERISRDATLWRSRERCAALFPAEFRRSLAIVLESLKELRKRGKKGRPTDHARIHAALAWSIFDERLSASRVRQVYEATRKALAESGYETPLDVETHVCGEQVVVSYSTASGTRGVVARRPRHFLRQESPA